MLFSAYVWLTKIAQPWLTPLKRKVSAQRSVELVSDLRYKALVRAQLLPRSPLLLRAQQRRDFKMKSRRTYFDHPPVSATISTCGFLYIPSIFALFFGQEPATSYENIE